jgi:predicted oxidoreductase
MATAGRTAKLDDDLTVSAIGFGAGALTSGYGDVEDAESLATLNRCLDLGVTFIDTANVYGGGDNERLSRAKRVVDLEPRCRDLLHPDSPAAVRGLSDRYQGPKRKIRIAG